MNTKNYKGPAVYNPSGRAGEYSYWATNFYNGCTGGCAYCYNRKGFFKKVLGANEVTLKRSLKNPEKALDLFYKDVFKNIDELRRHGLFFVFVSDPFLLVTKQLTYKAIRFLRNQLVPAKFLTKQAAWTDEFLTDYAFDIIALKLFAFGFTLTGHDELEPGCSPNTDRINAMRKIHNAGFKTFASIEPVIDFKSSKQMINQSVTCCDHYKIGLESGKIYDKDALLDFIEEVNMLVIPQGKTIYWKESVLSQAGIKRSQLPSLCVTADYNIFRQPHALGQSHQIPY